METAVGTQHSATATGTERCSRRRLCDGVHHQRASIWLTRLKWPRRPRVFLRARISSASRSSRASRSRTIQTLYARARPAAVPSTLRSRRSRPARGADRRVAPAVLADARARAPARRRRAEARRRHRAVGSPGRRAVGNADRADRRDRAPERQRRRGARRRSRTLDEEELRRRETTTRTTVDEDDDDDRGGGRGRRARGLGRIGRRERQRRSLDEDEEQLPEQPEDPGAARRFWFEHATGAGKTVAALGFVEASRTGGILILTHRRNLVDQFLGELRDRGYSNRISPPLLRDQDRGDGPVTVETYQWFVRNAGNISDAYTIVICDEAHTALGEKTSASIRRWHGPVFVGMTATGALIARHVTDLFPTQTSRFDLAQAARRGVIAPLRCVRIPPGQRRPHARQRAAAKGRGRPGLRPGGAGRAARPGSVQRGGRRPLPRALQAPARHRLQRRREARHTTSRRRSRPRA